MSLKAWIGVAKGKSASDLHVEPGLPIAIRTAGRLATVGEPVAARVAMEEARKVCGEEGWRTFLSRRSYDVSQVIAGVRCRVNVLQSARGVGLSVRLLTAAQPTLAGLNLHPDLARIARNDHGLVLIVGATGSGKSSTLAALVEEINTTRARHVITIEQPIEYWMRPKRCYIRQREVGRDTPSFEQALVDAMREDPDVIVVGEMRRAETMRLALDAAETGHLTFATMHAGSVAEAVSRLVASFPAEAQPGVRAQLAGCLQAVIWQSLAFHPAAGARVAELEVLTATPAVGNFIRDGSMFKIASALETGSADGMWSRARYRRWLDTKTSWSDPGARRAGEDAPVQPPRPSGVASLPAMTRAAAPSNRGGERPARQADVLVLDDGGEIDDIIAQLNKRKGLP